MAAVSIKLAPEDKMVDLYFAEDKISLARELRNYYIPTFPMEVKCAGEEAAEEMFDLTNNPSREDERLRLYGRNRSVSVGDIVWVDGVDYLCMSTGWAQL